MSPNVWRDMPPQRRLPVTPKSLLEIRTPVDLCVSPDGSRIVFALEDVDWDDNKSDQHLYIVRTTGDAEPRQLTRGDGFESLPQFSPDGEWLAFLRTEPESDDAGLDDEMADDARMQVWVLPMDGLGGEAERLTDAPRGVTHYEWIPIAPPPNSDEGQADGSAASSSRIPSADDKPALGIVYLAREPRPAPLQAAYEDRLDAEDDASVDRSEIFRQQIWRIDVETRKPKLVHAGDPGVGEVTVSPDGTRVAFSTNYTGEENDYHLADIWTIALDGEGLTRLTDGPGGKYHPRWEPAAARAIADESTDRVFFLRGLDPLTSFSQPNLYSVCAQGQGDVRLETEALAGDIAGWRSYAWDAAGVLCVSVAVGTSTQLFRRVPGGDFVPLVADEAHLHEFVVSPNGGVAYVTSDCVNPPELFWLQKRMARGRASESSHQGEVALSDFNGDWDDRNALHPVMTVSWTSTDGVEIEGLLTIPRGLAADARHPMLVYVHGGPYARALQATTSGSLHQVLASCGFAVLSPNYRGSEGYGNDFGIAIRGDLGGIDYEDVITGVDWAVEAGVADPERLGIMGSSYGGYLANLAIARSRRFKAAVSAFGIFSLVSDYLNSQSPRWESEYLAGTYWDKPEIYHERSPLSLARAIQTPILVMHGDSDGNTFFSNSQELYTALRILGKPVEFVRFPREGHGFSEPRHRIDEMERLQSWFSKYLLAESPATFRIGDKVVADGWNLTVTSVEPVTVSDRAPKNRQFVEVTFVLHDGTETQQTRTIRASDVTVAKSPAAGATAVRPAGLPVHALGRVSLARGTGWTIDVRPQGEERGAAAAVSVVFALSRAGGRHYFRVAGFAPVGFELPPGEPEEEERG